MSVTRLPAQLRNSLWFIPAMWVVGSGVLALAMIAVDSATPDFAAGLPLVFGGGAEGARSVLSAIAGSMITVAGVVFSITIVALQLASSQFSPRVLRNFMRDRLSQAVLGSLIGAFFYSLLVLRAIRTELEGQDAFVPSLAVTMAILLTVVAVAMLVFFIHHISMRIQVSRIVDSIAKETLEAIVDAWAMDDDEDHDPNPSPEPRDEPGRVAADDSGYLQLIDVDGLAGLATELDLVVRVDQPPGEWVQAESGLFSVWPAHAGSDRLRARLNRQVTLGPDRSLDQDVAFGLRQLVDVAVKSLSPGINDPTSARDCVNRLAQLLVDSGRRPEARRRFSRDGRLRLILTLRTFDELVAIAFDELRHYGGRTPTVALALAEALWTVRSLVDPKHHEPLGRQARLLLEMSRQIEPEADRLAVQASLARILAP